MGLAAVTPSQGGGLPPGDVYEHEIELWVDQVWVRQSGSGLQWQPATAQLFPGWGGTDGSGPSNRITVSTSWQKFRWPTSEVSDYAKPAYAMFFKSPTGALQWTLSHPLGGYLTNDFRTAVVGPMNYIIRHDQSSVTPDVISVITWPVPSSLRQVATVPGQRPRSFLRKLLGG